MIDIARLQVADEALEGLDDHQQRWLLRSATIRPAADHRPWMRTSGDRDVPCEILRKRVIHSCPVG